MSAAVVDPRAQTEPFPVWCWVSRCDVERRDLDLVLEWFKAPVRYPDVLWNKRTADALMRAGDLPVVDAQGRVIGHAFRWETLDYAVVKGLVQVTDPSLALPLRRPRCAIWGDVRRRVPRPDGSAVTLIVQPTDLVLWDEAQP